MIDDPIKNAEEAHSPSAREKAWEWYQSVAYTRLEPGASIILTMARWHEDDLAGRLLEEAASGGEQWDVCCLPAVAEQDDALGREPGEALWPERFDAEALESIKGTVGSHVWSALYQQHPSPASGSILRRQWFHYWRPPGRQLSPVTVRTDVGAPRQIEAVELPDVFDETLQSWDMAFTDTEASHYVVGQVWGLLGADRFLLDQVRDRLDFPATVAAVRSLSSKWRLAARKLIENKANGAAVIASLQHEIGGLVPVDPQGSKLARCHAVAAQLEAGNVYLPHPHVASWVSDFLDECVRFPTGKYDDQLDAMTQLLNHQRQTQTFVVARPSGASRVLDAIL